MSILRIACCCSLVAFLGCTASTDDSSAIAKESQTENQKDGDPDPTQRTQVHTNRLARETSPYLLLHAHNPVDWYAWGPEAFEKAADENKIVFLSVGYSSCHWCHVMERESFMDDEIAGFLNENFVCIKVDREERPDVDAIYMTGLHIYNQVSGSGSGGGWPMSMFLTPDAKPFFGGTYFPARNGDRGATTGFFTIIQRIQELWATRSEDLKRDAETLTGILKTELDAQRPSEQLSLEPAMLDKAWQALRERYDPVYGGFGFNEANPRRPKFPEPSNLLFLMDRIGDPATSEEDKQLAEKSLVHTLERMAMGGIWDHLGGGFHRYSVDRFWRIPHFEKMLYDNGQLTSVYAAAFGLTGRDDFKRVVDETLSFVEREMMSPDGGFYSALDAESEGEEGKFYRWTREEIRQNIEDDDDYDLFAKVYGVDSEPNFEGEYYALQISKPWSELAAELGMTEQELEGRLAPMRQTLLGVRAERPRPLTDTKILTSWNGLMIRGFADAGRELKNPAYVATAIRAARFVLDKLRQEDGRLLRTYSNGEATLNAYLDDYAFLTDAMLAIYRATGDDQWLQNAADLTELQIELFGDDATGGFYFTSSDHESLIARGRSPSDGAEPSGNSVAADNLVFLGKALDRPNYLSKAEGTFRAFAAIFERSPAAAPRMSMALGRWLDATKAETP